MAVLPIPTLGRSNSRIKLLRAAFSGNDRIAEGLVAVEGENLVREAIRSQVEIRTIFVTERFGAPAWLPRAADVVGISDEVLAGIVDTKHPQGIAALIRPPAWSLKTIDIRDAFLIVVNRLQDPGNLGTLIRSAEAFGVTATLVTADTVSPWNQKAIRASAGSVFRMPVVEVSQEELNTIRERGVSILAAVASSSTDDVIQADAMDLRGAVALVIGNEGSGLDESILRIADARITIPMPGQVESLNAGVAGSLLMYEAARQRYSSHEPL